MQMFDDAHDIPPPPERVAVSSEAAATTSSASDVSSHTQKERTVTLVSAPKGTQCFSQYCRQKNSRDSEMLPVWWRHLPTCGMTQVNQGEV